MYLPFLKNSLAAQSSAILISIPGFRSDLIIDSSISFMASSFEFRLGANPPSSPTEVESFIECKISFKFIYTSEDHCIACVKDSAPLGMIINSWISMLLSACSPPFNIFNIGIGKDCCGFSPVISLYKSEKCS